MAELKAILPELEKPLGQGGAGPVQAGSAETLTAKVRFGR
jgi:hypothetical protein